MITKPPTPLKPTVPKRSDRGQQQQLPSQGLRAFPLPVQVTRQAPRAHPPMPTMTFMLGTSRDLVLTCRMLLGGVPASLTKP